MTAPPITHVGGRYRLDELIGRGGMAAVYRGHDEQLDRPVAVKLLRDDLADDPPVLRRFEAEASRAASVRHPNVVAVYDVGAEDARPFIVMELVTGGDLAASLAAGRPMRPDRAARIAIDVAAALEAAHAAGVVHRDIKPSNVLLDEEGRARVADFGIARAAGQPSVTRTGAVLGSVDYLSPEQARGERATAASDIYALGVVLYELVTGRRPFSGESPYAVATARLRRPPPDPRKIEPAVPAPLAAIIARAMAREPGDRFASAGAMREALESWLSEASTVTAARVASDTPALALAPTARRDAAIRGRRRRGLAGALAVAVAAALVLVILAWSGTLPVGEGDDEPGRADIVAGTPGGEAMVATDDPASDTPAPASPEPTPSAEATPGPTPETEPAGESPVPTAAPPRPTPAPVAVADGPADAVTLFYRYVVDGDFDAAYALWSARMREAYPRRENLDERWANTASVTFTQLDVVSQTADAATVQANFVERYDGGGSREFIGYWELVRVDQNWLLDEPHY